MKLQMNWSTHRLLSFYLSIHLFIYLFISFVRSPATLHPLASAVAGPLRLLLAPSLCLLLLLLLTRLVSLSPDVMLLFFFFFPLFLSLLLSVDFSPFLSSALLVLGLSVLVHT